MTAGAGSPAPGHGARWVCRDCEVAWSDPAPGGSSCWSCGAPGVTGAEPAIGRAGLYEPSRPPAGSTWGLVTGEFA